MSEVGRFSSNQVILKSLKNIYHVEKYLDMKHACKLYELKMHLSALDNLTIVDSKYE